MVQCRFELFLLVVRFVVVLCRQFFYLLVRQNSRQMFFFLENDRPDLLSQKQQIGDNYEREKEQQPTTKGTTRNEKWKLRTECVCFYYNCCCFSFVFIIVYVFFFSSALPSYVSFAILPVCPLSLRFRLLLRFSFNSFE